VALCAIIWIQFLSEAIGFIAAVDDNKDAVDYPFAVTSHEVAHQWAHQVIANVQGATMLSESLSEVQFLEGFRASIW
jgi:ABC-2 type transport system permease protein